MGFYDTLNYVFIKNPISSAVIDTTKSAGGYLFSRGGSSVPSSLTPSTPPIPESLRQLAVERVILSGSPYVRVAGLSGALAVLLGAYGAHSFPTKTENRERKRVYETANRYHFIHTLALLGVPLSRCPKTTFTFLSLGMTLFCATCYYDAFTGDTRFRKYTPVGGTFLVIGWLCLVV